MSGDVLALAAATEGHFRLESGHHSRLWLDLDAMFVKPAGVQPFVDELARALRPHDPAGVCGPLVGGAFLAQMVASSMGLECFFTERIHPVKSDGLYQARYRLPPALRECVGGKRLAVVDDVISAGSAVRGTFVELQSYRALPVAVGALVVLGDLAVNAFLQQGIPLEAVARRDYDSWEPAECPLCAASVPIKDMASPTSG
jgi:orotate phosphoribosyltransferase